MTIIPESLRMDRDNNCLIFNSMARGIKTMKLIKMLVIGMLCVSMGYADTNAPVFYIVQSTALEAHHGDNLRSSGVGAITHIGVDYGSWAIEGVTEEPLYQTQQHTRRSIGVDLLVKPFQFSNGVEPYIIGGAGYYWGSDPYQCLAVDIGLGVRFHISKYVFFQVDARDAIPYDGSKFLIPGRFQIVSFGLGARY